MRDKPEQNGIGMPFCSGLFFCHKTSGRREYYHVKKQLKQTKNINIIFDKKNICSYNISIATLEMLNNLLLLENLVSFDFPFSWLSAEGG